MSDAIAVALIGAVGIMASAVVPALIALSNRRKLTEVMSHARQAQVAAAAAVDATTTGAQGLSDAINSIADSVGVKNGNGDLMAMVARVMGDQAEIMRWQEAHADDDSARFSELLEKNLALSEYTHERMHDVMNLLAGTKGKTDLLWREFEKQHGGSDE